MNDELNAKMYKAITTAINDVLDPSEFFVKHSHKVYNDARNNGYILSFDAIDDYVRIRISHKDSSAETKYLPKDKLVSILGSFMILLTQEEIMKMLIILNHDGCEDVYAFMLYLFTSYSNYVGGEYVS
jgi:hypothetical protein